MEKVRTFKDKHKRFDNIDNNSLTHNKWPQSLKLFEKKIFKDF